MPEFEAWPGQIEATRMLFATHASSKEGPRCYEHDKDWQAECHWCQTAQAQVPIWEENKRRAVAHEERLASGEWAVVNLAIRLDDYLFDGRYGNETLTPREVLEWAFRLAKRVREQASDVNYPLIEQFGQEVLDELRAGSTSPARAATLRGGWDRGGW